MKPLAQLTYNYSHPLLSIIFISLSNNHVKNTGKEQTKTLEHSISGSLLPVCGHFLSFCTFTAWLRSWHAGTARWAEASFHHPAKVQKDRKWPHTKRSESEMDYVLECSLTVPICYTYYLYHHSTEAPHCNNITKL